MAKATAHCTCKKCGANFIREKICYNREEANRWEAWASENFDLCGDCYSAEQKEQRDTAYANAIEKYHLPVITGVSEKQIKYADDLRRRLFEKFPDLADKHDKMTELVHSEKFMEMCAENGITEPTEIDAQRERMFTCKRFLSVMHVIRTTGDARQIIDATQKLNGYGF